MSTDSYKESYTLRQIILNDIHKKYVKKYRYTGLYNIICIFVYFILEKLNF